MDTNRVEVVLRAFRPFYRLLSIYGAADVHHSDGHRSAYKAVIFSVFGFSMCVAWLSEIAHCVQHSFRLSEMAQQLAMAIQLTSITVTYVSFGMKKHLVGEAMDRLQATINASMAQARIQCRFGRFQEIRHFTATFVVVVCCFCRWFFQWTPCAWKDARYRPNPLATTTGWSNAWLISLNWARRLSVPFMASYSAPRP